MPTAGKLIGAVLVAALAWVVSGFVPPLLPEGTPTGLLQPVNAAVGFLMGWRILGRNAGEGIVGTIGHASTSVVATVFWCVFIWAGEEMIEKSTKLFYDGPVHALQDMALMMLGNLQLIATPEIIAGLVVGALVAAWLTEGAANRWA